MFKRVLYVIAVAAIFAGCSEDNTAVAPDPPPQIGVSNRWLVAYDGAGKQTSLHSNDVYDILVTSNGEVWMGSGGGIAVYAEQSNGGAGTTRIRAYTNTSGLPNPKIRRLIELDGKIYAATWGGGVGVYDIAAGTWSALAIKVGSRPGLLSPLVNDIEVIGGVLYFSTNAGASIYDPVTDTWSQFAKAQKLSYPTYHSKNCPDCPINPLVSTIAAGTTSRGLEKWYGIRVDFGLSPEKTAKYGVTVDVPLVAAHTYYKVNPNGLPELSVNDIYFDSDTGHFWLALASKGLAEVDPEANLWTRHTAIQGLPSNTVYSITKVKGRLWIATQAGVAAQRNDGRWQGYGRGAGLREVRIRRVYTDDGERLWAATISGGAMLLNPNAEGL